MLLKNIIVNYKSYEDEEMTREQLELMFTKMAQKAVEIHNKTEVETNGKKLLSLMKEGFSLSLEMFELGTYAKSKGF